MPSKFENKHSTHSLNVKLELDPIYINALNSFWHNDFKSTIELISDQMTDQTPPQLTFQLYRLWIETLATTESFDALKKLNKHLLVRSYEETVHSYSWIALRGLAHLELDEIQAVRLMVKSVHKQTNNPYCMELQQRFQWRMHKTNLFKQPLLNLKQPSMDFFHWQIMAQCALANNNKLLLNDILLQTNKIFPESPLNNLFNMHLDFEVHDYYGILDSSEKLKKKFPQNEQYKIANAYAHYKMENYEKCISLLANDQSLAYSGDAQQILGFAKLKLSETTDIPQNEIKKHFSSAINYLNQSGHSAIELAKVLQTIEENDENYISKTAEEMLDRPLQTWMIKLNQQKYFDISTKDQETIQSLNWCMGNQAKSGDLVFLASECPYKKTWKMIAIYLVTSNSTWHPFEKYQNALELIYRIEHPVEMDIEIEDENTNQSTAFSYEDPYKYDVYNLEMGALDAITETIKQRNDENDSKLFNMISSLKLSA